MMARRYTPITMVVWSAGASQVASFGSETLPCFIVNDLTNSNDVSVTVYIDSLWLLHTPHSNTQSSCDSEKLPG